MRTIDPGKYAAQRGAILDAAKTCFARNGFHRTSTEVIGTEAGVSSGKLFHYFPNKKAIILAVVEDQARQTIGYIGSLLQRPDLCVALWEFLATILAFAGDEEERRLILEIDAEGARDPDVGVLNAMADRKLAGGLVVLLTEAIGRGQMKPVVPAEQAARFLMILIDGIFSRASVDAGFDPVAEHATLQTILRTILCPEGDGSDE